MEKLENIGVHEFKRLVKDVSNLYVGSSAVVSRVVAESNADNKSDEALPPLVPHQLVVLSH